MIETDEGTNFLLNVNFISISKFYLEVKPEDMNVDPHITGMQSDTRYGDYSSSRSDCTIILICNTTKERIKPGSCKFT